jgi:flagellar basal-body rod protein FlgC
VNGILNVSTSALIAQRTRLDAIAANIANASIGGSLDGPDQPPALKEVLFAPGDPANDSPDGVHVEDIREVHAYVPRIEPNHPYADSEGRVWYPDVNPVEQEANMMLAARSYEANIAVIEATKSMINSALEILA